MHGLGQALSRYPSSCIDPQESDPEFLTIAMHPRRGLAEKLHENTWKETGQDILPL